MLGLLVGGNITVQGGTLAHTTIQPARLSAPGGPINLIAVASAGEVLTNAASAPADPTLNGFTSLGTISLTQGADVTLAPTDNEGIRREIERERRERKKKEESERE